MLNAVCVKPFDYKSIALPAELQGLLFLRSIFIINDQLNQRKKDMFVIEHCYTIDQMQCTEFKTLITSLLRSLKETYFVRY